MPGKQSTSGTARTATVPARVLMLPVAGYRRFVSPLLGPRCRFAPSCSEYALTALAERGAGALAGGSAHRPVPSVPPRRLRSGAGSETQGREELTGAGNSQPAERPGGMGHHAAALRARLALRPGVRAGLGPFHRDPGHAHPAVPHPAVR